MNPSDQITQSIEKLPSWQGKIIADFRALILTTNPDVKEEWKWNTGMWTVNGKLLCGYGAFKAHVKLNFMQGSELPDPNKLFNNGFEAKNSRSIDVREGEELDQGALKQLIANAVAFATA